MDKPSFKLVGGPCGQHGQYTFYKALRITGEKERIIAIGDFFFVRIWQDSELVSIGELQLLWTDRVSDQTLVSLRLYFLPENTPDGRNQHGQDEVLAINDKVVLKAEDLLSWVSCGEDWHWGLRAVWRGACAPPANPRRTQPLHHTRLDFSDVEREKNAINEDADSPGVVVFSYPRYCRYRALLSRLEGIQGDWLRDSLVAALGGYAAPTKNTRILYCKDTFEYPELEGHEFVCNQLAPKLKGRPRGRRRRRADRLEPEHEPGPGDDARSSDSDDQKRVEPKQRPRRLSLRNGAPKYSDEEPDKEQPAEDRAFLQQLKQFYRSRREPFKLAHSLKDREYPEPYTPEYSDEEPDKEQPAEDRAFLQQLKQFYRSRREPFKLAHSLKDREYPEPYTPEYSDEEPDKEQPAEDRAFLQQLKQFYRSRREPFKLAHSLKDREYPEPYTPEYSDEEPDKEQPAEDRAFLQQLKQFYRSRREPFKLAHSLKDREYPEPYTPEYSDEEPDKEQPAEDRAFLQQLKQFYRSRREPFKLAHSLKDLSLRSLYQSVTAAGGYEAACRHKLWRRIHAPQPNTARRHYERVLLPLEQHEVSRGALTLPRLNGAAAHAHAHAHAHGPAHAHAPRTIATIELPDSREPSPAPHDKDGARDFSVTCKPAEELNREFLESLPKEESKLKISVKPVEKLLEESKKEKEEPREGAFYSELAQKLKLGDQSKFLSDSSPQPGLVTSSALSSLSSLVNGHAPPKEQSRPPTRSSLRAVRVKPARAQLAAPPSTPPIPLLRPDSASSSPPAGSTPSAPAAAAVTNFGIHHPPPPAHSDDDIVEVPYKPKTPEIIDLDEYPESPQAIKRKKLDILKERGLEVTAIPSAPPAAAAGCWPPAAPLAAPLAPLAVQHQLLTQAQLFQMYNIVHPAYANGAPPPKVIQATSAFGSCGPEKTVYGNPKDPFMPPPHVLTGAPLKPQRNSSSSAPLAATPPQDILDLTCKGLQPPSQTQKPAVEIVRIPSVPSPSKLTTQNLAKNYTLVDGKAVVGSNLEITLVNPKSQTPTKSRQQQKRSSNGKFVGAKTPTPPKDYPKSYISPSPSGVKKPPIIVPNYQVNQRDDISPTSSTGSGNSQTNLQNNLLQNAFKGPNSLQQMMDMQKNVPSMPYVDPMYMSALYSSLAGGMDQRQLAMYRDFMANQFRGYSGLLGVTPTTKN